MPETPSSPLADERETRLKRLEKIRASGVDPYPAKCRRTKYNQEILSGFESLSASQEVFFIAGRMMELRVHGGSAFANLEDETGKVQIYFKKDVLGEQYALTGSLDIGDFLEVEGTVFKTKQGEITVLVKNFVLLAKALRNLPSQWYGLKDVEERYRRRYVDLIVNKDVRDLFRLQSRFIQAFRNFYLEKDFLEARTPVLENIPGGAEADPFITHHNALDADFYLRISLELHLKRLMVGGYEKIFEIGPVFRNEGMDTQHLQEFTMLESYEAYKDLDYLIDFVQKLYTAVIDKVFGGLKVAFRDDVLNFSAPWPRLDYYELVQKYSGIDLSQYDSVESLMEAVKKKKFDLRLEGNEGMGRVIDKLYKKSVRPHLVQPCVLVNHPLSVSPLAKKKAGDPLRVDRMQIVAAGFEVGNGFAELNDPLDQRGRFEEQMKLREAGDVEAQMLDEDFIEALEYGMPPTAGFGVGLERLFMLCANADSIRDTVFFPMMKPK